MPPHWNAANTPSHVPDVEPVTDPVMPDWLPLDDASIQADTADEPRENVLAVVVSEPIAPAE
jgi:hypothetical protein